MHKGPENCGEGDPFAESPEICEIALEHFSGVKACEVLNVRVLGCFETKKSWSVTWEGYLEFSKVQLPITSINLAKGSEGLESSI